MPSITLHTTPLSTTQTPSPLPTVLHTPSGLAILEVQGTINFPLSPSDTSTQTPIGRLEFPLYSAGNLMSDEKWMRKVYFYVGQYQQLVGEVRRLVKPLAVIRKREGGLGADVMHDMEGIEGGDEREELEIVEVVRFKIVFQGRPEPVSAEDGG